MSVSLHEYMLQSRSFEGEGDPRERFSFEENEILNE